MRSICKRRTREFLLASSRLNTEISLSVYGRGRGVGRGLDVGVDRALVAVAVAVGVADAATVDVAVAVGVADAATVAVGVGEAPPQGLTGQLKISIDAMMFRPLS